MSEEEEEVLRHSYDNYHTRLNVSNAWVDVDVDVDTVV